MIEITHRRLSPPNTRDVQHITDLRWFERGTDRRGDWTRQKMVEWIDSGGQAVVNAGFGDVDVATVHPALAADYVRTEANGRPNDNLVNLPPF